MAATCCGAGLRGPQRRLRLLLAGARLHEAALGDADAGLGFDDLRLVAESTAACCASAAATAASNCCCETSSLASSPRSRSTSRAALVALASASRSRACAAASRARAASTSFSALVDAALRLLDGALRAW